MGILAKNMESALLFWDKIGLPGIHDTRTTPDKQYGDIVCFSPIGSLGVSSWLPYAAMASAVGGFFFPFMKLHNGYVA